MSNSNTPTVFYDARANNGAGGFIGDPYRDPGLTQSAANSIARVQEQQRTQRRSSATLTALYRGNPDPSFWRALAAAGSGEALVLRGLHAINPDPGFWTMLGRFQDSCGADCTPAEVAALIHQRAEQLRIADIAGDVLLQGEGLFEICGSDSCLRAARVTGRFGTAMDGVQVVIECLDGIDETCRAAAVRVGLEGAVDAAGTWAFGPYYLLVRDVGLPVVMQALGGLQQQTPSATPQHMGDHMYEDHYVDGEWVNGWGGQAGQPYMCPQGFPAGPRGC